MMRDYKKVNVNGINLYDVKIKYDEYVCTIERTDRDEYMVYSESGEGVSIARLTTIDIVELLATGSIDSTEMTISPKGTNG